MALNLDTNVNVNTAEFDAKIKTASEKAKKNLSDISKGLRVAGPAVSAFGERLKNLTSVGFAGIMAAGVGILVAGFQKAQDIWKDLARGMIEDMQTLHADLESAMAREEKRLDAFSEAVRIIEKAKHDGIKSAEEAQKVREAIDTVEKKTGPTGMAVTQHGSNYVFSGLGVPQEEQLDAMEIDNRIEIINRKIASLQGIINSKQALHDDLLRDVSPLTGYASATEARKVAMSMIPDSEKIIQLREEIKRLQGQKQFVSARVSAREDDTTTRLARENAKLTIKDLEEQKKKINFGDREQSQIFTNELTRRGGFQSGGMVWDDSRYQSQVLRQFQNAVNQLQAIEQRIEQLKKI